MDSTKAGRRPALWQSTDVFWVLEIKWLWSMTLIDPKKGVQRLGTGYVDSIEFPYRDQHGTCPEYVQIPVQKPVHRNGPKTLSSMLPKNPVHMDGIRTSAI